MGVSPPVHGVNVQTALWLAGHENASTHMRYVRIAETLAQLVSGAGGA
jgi:hypothetical protein